jgi:peptidoglycan-N-acetylglucosamine deacetylase
VPWLWLVLLLVIGGAVVAARSLGRPNAVEPVITSVPTRGVTPSGVPAGAARPTAQATLAPTVVARPSVGATPTVLREHATPVATQVPTHPPTVSVPHTPTPNPQGAGPQAAGPTSPPTPEATVVPTVAATHPPTVAPPTTADSSAQHAGPVALTFDAGADRGYAEDILDDLGEAHVVASFGITGQWAKANPDLVRRMAADGHLVFNHTLDHRSFTGLSDSLGGLSAAARRAELDGAEAIIAPLIGHSTRPYYRLPYGDDDAHVAADVAPDGYTRKIGWTVDSEGWRGLQSTDILARCLKLAAPGAIYVMHVGRQSQDAIALPQLISNLRDKGFSFQRADDR